MSVKCYDFLCPNGHYLKDELVEDAVKKLVCPVCKKKAARLMPCPKFLDNSPAAMTEKLRKRADWHTNTSEQKDQRRHMVAKALKKSKG